MFTPVESVEAVISSLGLSGKEVGTHVGSGDGSDYLIEGLYFPRSVPLPLGPWDLDDALTGR